MVVGSLTIEFHLPAARSLKDKRQVVRGVLERARRRFNVSISEVGNQDLWRSARIGAASVGSSARVVESELRKLVGFIEAQDGLDSVNVEIEIY